MGEPDLFTPLMLHAATPWVLGGLACLQLAAAWRHLRGTTLAAPAAWGLAAATAITLSALSGTAGTASDRYLEYAAAVFLLAPGLAVLGAKRPQSGAWQFIVGTFVGILMLPVLSGLAAGLTEPQPYALFRWLNLAVFAVGAGNYGPTARIVPLGLACIGVAPLLAACVPGGFGRTDHAELLALVCLNGAMAAAWFTARKTGGATRGVGSPGTELEFAL